LIKLIGILAHVVSDFSYFIKVTGPLCNAVGRLFLLQTSKNCLIFNGDFHQLLLALNSIQTCLFNTHGVVELRLWVLHDIRHFLEQNTVFPLDFSITPYNTN